MVKLILGGGGDSKDSKPLDELLMSLTRGKILYIPVAWKSGDFDECKNWFSNNFNKYGIRGFGMLTDLEHKTFQDINEFDAIYLGGGNTFKLLHEIKRTKFIQILHKFIKEDKPVYGGSAGAIILGKNVETAGFGIDSDENYVNIVNFEGLNLVGGYTLQCHYEESQDNEIFEFVKKNNLPIIALSERSGLFVDNAKITVKGYDSAQIFLTNRKIKVDVNDLIKSPNTYLD